MRSKKEITSNTAIISYLSEIEEEYRREAIIHYVYDDFIIHPDCGKNILEYELVPRNFDDFLINEFQTLEEIYAFCSEVGASKPELVPLTKKAIIAVIEFDWGEEEEDAPRWQAWGVISDHESWSGNSMEQYPYNVAGLNAAKEFCEKLNIPYEVLDQQKGNQ